MKRHRLVKLCILCPLVALVLVAVFSAVVMWLWNAILPEVTGAREITYLQAAGILVLAKILFGGFWGGRRRAGGRGRHALDLERWHALTPEQRQEMREEMRRRFGAWPAPACCESSDQPPEHGTSAGSTT